MEEELSFEEKYKRLDLYKVLLDEPEMLLRYVTYGTYLNLLGTPEVFELIMTKIKYDWYDMVNDWIIRTKKGETIQIENQQIPLSVLHDVFDYIDSVIQIYKNTMNPMEEESNQGSFDYLTFRRFWSLYNVTLYEMALQFKKVDNILEEMEQEIQQKSDSDIRIEETKPTLSEIDITKEITPIPKKKSVCKDISDEQDKSDKYKPRDPNDKPKKRGRLNHLFEIQNKKKTPEKASEKERIVTEAITEVLEEKDEKNEPLNKNEDNKRIKVKVVEKVVQKTQEKLDGKLISKKPEPKKKEKTEKSQKRSVPEPEKRIEPQAEKSNPLDALYASGILTEENIDRAKEERIKQEKFEKKEIDLTEPIEEINIKDELTRKNEKTEKQKDVGKPRLSSTQRKKQEERKIKKQRENKLLDKDKQKVLQLIKKKEFTKIIPKSDELKEILKTKLAKDPQIVVFLKVEELQKPETEWIVIDTPQQYLNGITFGLDNKTYFVLGEKSVQVTLRDIEEVRKSIRNIILETMRDTMKTPGYESNQILQNAFIVTNKWIQQRLPTLTFEYIAHNLDYEIDMSTKTMHFNGTILYVRLGMGVNLKIDLSEFIG